ncbi:MAG: DNA replication/repair protein RecF [Deltaproteobacteria bacterium]|nr:DNA replication/repair protein RecF [Deltaproteobacteria bacterium]
MYLKTLLLKQFRNFQKQSFDFNPAFNFIFGRNAQGKTNIIEAVYYLSALKSFRTTNREDLILKGADFMALKAVLEKDGMQWDLSVNLTPVERTVLLNNKKPQTRKEYHELIPLILFEPRHIYLFRDAPSLRRQYLNRAVFLQEAGFSSVLRDYEKALMQKNKILKEGRNLSLLEIWNDQLAGIGAKIVHARLQWLAHIHRYLSQEYEALSHAGDELRLVYHPSQNLLDGAAGRESTEIDDIKKILLDKIALLKKQEIERRESIVGPHRDDFSACLGERDVGQFASQGENRSVLIALKLAQLKMYTAQYFKSPLFLLDDVASELDNERCHYLFSYLNKEATQVFLTTTENKIHGMEYQGEKTVFKVGHGQAHQI